MTWARLDDSFWHNPKITALLDNRPEAIALHVAAISWCAQHLTDGLVEKPVLRKLVRWHHHRVHAAVSALVTQGVWEEVSLGVWQIHDYLDFNPSREEVLLRRAADAERQAKHRGLSRRDSQRPDPYPVRRKEGSESDFQRGVVDNAPSLDEEAKRLATICKWGGLPEAHTVVEELGKWLTVQQVGELVSHVANQKSRPNRPRYLLTVARSWAADQGIAPLAVLS